MNYALHVTYCTSGNAHISDMTVEPVRQVELYLRVNHRIIGSKRYSIQTRNFQIKAFSVDPRSKYWY